MYGEWQNTRPDIDITEQGLADRARYIRKNKIFTKVEEEGIQGEVQQRLQRQRDGLCASNVSPDGTSNRIRDNQTQENSDVHGEATCIPTQAEVDGEVRRCVEAEDPRLELRTLGDHPVQEAIGTDYASGRACDAEVMYAAQGDTAADGGVQCERSDGGDSAVSLSVEGSESAVSVEGTQNVTASDSGRDLRGSFESDEEADIASAVYTSYMIWATIPPGDRPKLPTPRSVPSKKINSETSKVNKILGPVCVYIEESTSMSQQCMIGNPSGRLRWSNK